MNKQIIVTADFSRKNGEPERRQIELSVSEDIARHLLHVSLSSLDDKLMIIGAILNLWCALNGYTDFDEIVAISEAETNE